MFVSRPLAVAALLALSACAELMPARQDFAVVNRTGYQIDNLYVRPQNGPWGRDVLGHGTVLTRNDSFNVYFPATTRTCIYDLRVRYHDGEEASWRGLNLCEISRVAIYYDRRNGQTRFRGE